MGRHILLAIIITLLIILGACGFALYKYANIGIFETSQSISNETPILIQQQNSDSSDWVSQLANVKKPNLTLPVNEIFIEFIRTPKAQTTREAYLLLIDKNDIYSLFCIREVLNGAGVDFTIVKDILKSQIYLNTKDDKLLKRVIQELKNYDIHSKVREVRL
ncbi:hypothetical protein [Campylobacter sp. 19-13652]|uniref:hypothetical protein n=1 Tax=Campylobacter sp. 19-13652 TaxID=2840180 RepID=UPI001C774327|nr:hypothetical protein [Campylobacter sp. 19-13652]BCX78974.1 hypothetical protein LBC_04360 [Campylobacter sp. 19-13652]